MQTKKTIRVGIVGAGFAASFHHRGITRVYGVNAEIAGVYSPRRAGEFAAARGLVAASDLDALIDQCDALHVCTTACTHEEIVCKVLAGGKFAIVEKPFTGYFGDGSEAFNGERFPKSVALAESLASIERMLAAERTSRGRILYAENWVYAPSVQKEREILTKTGAQILWIHAEEGHSGSHARSYGQWSHSGGGSMMGKGCHPLSAALYLKAVEGKVRTGQPIRPVEVSARTHSITRQPGFRDEGHLRTEYQDVEDFSLMHVVFEDGTVADIFASELILGGVHNWLEVAANNHRTICNINPNTSMQAYNPAEANFKEVYVVEKIGTKQGWSQPSPDEDWFTGYPQEIEAFYRTVAYGEPVESDSGLAANTISTIYSAYLSAERAGAAVPVRGF